MLKAVNCPIFQVNWIFNKEQIKLRSSKQLFVSVAQKTPSYYESRTLDKSNKQPGQDEKDFLRRIHNANSKLHDSSDFAFPQENY